MTSASTRALPRAALLAASAIFWAAMAPAQESVEPAAEPSATEPATEPGPEAAAPGDAAAAPTGTAQAEPQETVETIPVESAEADAPAASYPYTFAAARMAHVEFDDAGMDAFGVEGSYLLGEQTFGIVAYTGGELDEAQGTESSLYEVGVGYRQALNPTMDFNAGIRLLKSQLRSNADREEDLGYRFDAGVRTHVLAPQLEVAGGLRYQELGGSSHAFLAGSALYALLPRLSLGAELQFGNSSTTYAAVGRWAF